MNAATLFDLDKVMHEVLAAWETIVLTAVVLSLAVVLLCLLRKDDR